MVADRISAMSLAMSARTRAVHLLRALGLKPPPPRLPGVTPMATSNRYLSLTFDDGWIRGARKIHRLLRPDHATFYIVTGWIRNGGPPEVKDTFHYRPDHGCFRDWQKLSRLGHDIGSHTHAHIRPTEERKQVDYARSLAVLTRMHPGPYSLSFPWSHRGKVRAPFDSLRGGQDGPALWNDIRNPDLRQLVSVTPESCDPDSVVCMLRNQVPRDAWVILSLHSLDGEGYYSWTSAAVSAVIAAARQAGYRLRSVAEMTRLARCTDHAERCRLDEGDQDRLCDIDLYKEDWSDPQRPETPVTRSQQAIVAWLRRTGVRGTRILHVGIGASTLAAEMAPEAAAIDGITVVQGEQRTGNNMRLSNYRVFLLNKYGKNIRTLEGRYDFIVDNNLQSFTSCPACVFAMMDSYLALLAPGGAIVTHEEGLAWSDERVRGLAMTFENLQELEQSHPVRVERLPLGVIRIRRREAAQGAPSADGGALQSGRKEIKK